MFFESLIFAWFLIKFDQNPVNYVKKITIAAQLEIFKTVLGSVIIPKHELCILAKEIDWYYLEK